MTAEPQEMGQADAREQAKDDAPNATRQALTVQELGWSCEEARGTRARLATFEADWNAPRMEAYDDL